MKNFLRKRYLCAQLLLVLLLINSFRCVEIFSGEAWASQKGESRKSYHIDPDHSRVSFEVAHLMISTVSGEFKKFQGTYKFHPENFEHTELFAKAEVNSVDTGVKKRDEHLKSSDFFDAAAHPSMTFQSTSAKKTGKTTFDLVGNMTIRGVTKSVTFHVTYNGQLKMKDKTTQAFKATAQINRKDFGISFQNILEVGPAVGDLVTINISVEGH